MRILLLGVTTSTSGVCPQPTFDTEVAKEVPTLKRTVSVRWDHFETERSDSDQTLHRWQGCFKS